MTAVTEPATTERGGGKRRELVPTAVAPLLPRVNLLPEDVRAGQRLREVRGWFGLAVLLALVLVVAAWLFSMMVAGDARDDHLAEQQRTDGLLVEKKEFAAVVPVKTDLERTGKTVLLASGAEVLWADYLGAVTAVLPENVTLQTFVTQLADPTGGALSDDPLVTPGISAITFTGVANAAPDVASLIDSLNSITGFSDARVSVVQRNDQELYDVTASVQVTTDALSLRLMGEGQ